MDKVPRGTREALDPWYVTGFVEGEGTFTYSRASNGGFTVYFAVKLSSTDAAILEDLQSFFCVGKLYDVRARAPIPGAGFTKAAKYYRVHSTSDLKLLIGHFEDYPLRGAKRAGFEIWKEMVRLKDENFRKPPNDRLNELAVLLSAAAPRNQKWVAPEGVSPEQIALGRRPKKLTKGD